MITCGTCLQVFQGTQQSGDKKGTKRKASCAEAPIRQAKGATPKTSRLRLLQTQQA